MLLTKSLTLSLSTNHQRDYKDSSDEETGHTAATNSPQSKLTSSFIRASHNDDSSSQLDVSVDYWTILGQTNNDSQKEKKEGFRTIKSSLKSNVRLLTITRHPTISFDGKISSPLTMTYVNREKKQKSKKNNVQEKIFLRVEQMFKSFRHDKDNRDQ